MRSRLLMRYILHSSLTLCNNPAFSYGHGCAVLLYSSAPKAQARSKRPKFLIPAYRTCLWYDIILVLYNTLKNTFTCTALGALWHYTIIQVGASTIIATQVARSELTPPPSHSKWCLRRQGPFGAGAAARCAPRDHFYF